MIESCLFLLTYKNAYTQMTIKWCKMKTKAEEILVMKVKKKCFFFLTKITRLSSIDFENY